MSEPHIGEIRMTGFSFAPVGWAHCAGQLMTIAENEALFTILGTAYGGDGVTTFALPDLRGRVPLHVGAGLPRGTRAGEVTHTVTAEEMPAHSHALQTSTAISHYADPTGKTLGNVESGALSIYGPADGSATLAPSTLGAAGGSQPHQNIQPTTVVSFIIALYGVYPQQD